MIIAAVVFPSAFSAKHFSDPTYHLNAEACLRGIDINGVILLDTEGHLFQQLLDHISSLQNSGNGKTTQVLFEELLKKQKQKIVRFVKGACSCSHSERLLDVASFVALHCHADSVVVDPDNYLWLMERVADTVPVVQVQDYIKSNLEVERRRMCEALPSLDRMVEDDFNRVIVRATRFSRWLRFYDKQIGKGGNLNQFRKGIEKILRLWIEAAHFPKDQLQAELFTVVDESAYRQYEPSVAFHRVKGDLVKMLQESLGIPIKLSFKRDDDSICHARHLQTQSVSLLFERGFDFVEADGALRRAFVVLHNVCDEHLHEYRRLPEYEPPVVQAAVL